MKPLYESLGKHSPEFSKDLVVYGTDQICYDFYYTKIERAVDFLKKLDDEIIILADGFDVIVNKSLEGIEEEFKKFDCKLLISAEANCFPFKEYEDFFATKSDTILKYPCAGCWIGYREYVIELFTSQLATRNADIWRQKSDQGFLSTVYLESFQKPDHYPVKIDTEGKIFVNTFLLEQDKHFEVVNGHFYFTETNQIPYFVHFNGDGKVHMPLFGVGYMEE
jgi:hypothetical protein